MYFGPKNAKYANNLMPKYLKTCDSWTFLTPENLSSTKNKCMISHLIVLLTFFVMYFFGCHNNN